MVTTNDGCILKVFRVRDDTVQSRTGPDTRKPAVFFQHGLISSSETFVQSKDSLPFKLLGQGFDVWFGNNRGNIYSRKHFSKVEQGKDYFDFSFYELGKYDLPAMIDYVRKQTG